MADKKKYYKLDDIGIIGKQEKKSAGSFSYHRKKTGEILRQLRNKTNQVSDSTVIHRLSKSH